MIKKLDQISNPSIQVAMIISIISLELFGEDHSVMHCTTIDKQHKETKYRLNNNMSIYDFCKIKLYTCEFKRYYYNVTTGCEHYITAYMIKAPIHT